jgi:hypothetical protein
MSIKNYPFSTFRFQLLEMEFEFDKEIDALLRQTAQGETAFAANNPQSAIRNPHLDADEISLFAENALPIKARGHAVAHFADCNRCRSILSDLISQNSENEIVSTEQTEVFVPIVPWYRKLFAFPNLAYTLGALVLVFSGLVVFTVLQSVDKSQNADVSQISEQPLKGGPFLDDTAIVEEQSANAIMSSNSMSNASMSNAASVSSSNAPTDSAARSFNANSASNASTASNKSSVSANTSPKDEPRREEDLAGKLVTDLPLQSRTAKSLTEERRERTQKDKNEAETTDTAKSVPPKPEQPSVSENQITPGAPSARAKNNTRLQNVETSSVGGKTFKRAGNAWVDSAYKGQATINITRGTSEYKKLDSGLRSIAENLGGTVIIVWKDKAYRIQ